MELKRPMGVKIAPSANEIVVRMVAPRNSGGTMASKNIVIDAGHGGHDSGAKYSSGGQTLNEKDFTLAIAKLVSDALSDTGCTVAMTRNDDTFIELPDRPRVANDSNADFFVSIHINSNQLGNRSGTTTYYHFDNSDSRLLAQCIQAEIAKISGIGDYGVVSDRTVAPSKGFSVLRNSRVPAVLVEVAYINNSIDRRLLQTEGFRKKVAEAIVRGIKVYIGEQKN
ncbi:MAG: N-acetylmuramoyl-L-alanine amidase [Armatimonadetes bacterium]|nr:N-acetylmuramoyl-L-alanine amidase [Armatimonadota bacterium]